MLNFIDPLGLNVKRDKIVGTYDDFLAASATNERYIYTCNCGWLDSSHVKGWHGLFGDVMNWLKNYHRIAHLDLNRGGQYGRTKLGFGFRSHTFNVDEWNLDARKNLSEAILLILSMTSELHQTDYTFAAVGAFIMRSGTATSLEDSPSDWVGIKLASALYGEKEADFARAFPDAKNPRIAAIANTLREWCGTVLSAKAARALYDKLGSELLKKNYDHHPYLYSSCTDECVAAEPSIIFDATAAKNAFDRAGVVVEGRVTVKGRGWTAPDVTWLDEKDIPKIVPLRAKPEYRSPP